MKKLLVALTIVSSMSAMAYYETDTGTSYSGPRGGGLSGTTALSGTSEVGLKEQVAANRGAIAAFLQANEAMASSVEIKEVVELGRQVLHEEVEAMSDRAVLDAVLSR
jgi:ABC-type hemin transport system ATPase subunit